MRAVPSLLLRAGASVLLTRRGSGNSTLPRKPDAAILVVVPSTILLGDALAERLAARRVAP